HALYPLEHHLARDIVPVVGLVEHVEVRVAAVHLRGDTVALARELLGVGRPFVLAQVREMLGAAKVPACRHQRSRFRTAAAIPIPPTSASEPGARSGGPMTMLTSGSRN